MIQQRYGITQGGTKQPFTPRPQQSGGSYNGWIAFPGGYKPRTADAAPSVPPGGALAQPSTPNPPGGGASRLPPLRGKHPVRPRPAPAQPRPTQPSVGGWPDPPQPELPPKTWEQTRFEEIMAQPGFRAPPGNPRLAALLEQQARDLVSKEGRAREAARNRPDPSKQIDMAALWTKYRSMTPAEQREAANNPADQENLRLIREWQSGKGIPDNVPPADTYGGTPYRGGVSERHGGAYGGTPYSPSAAQPVSPQSAGTPYGNVNYEQGFGNDVVYSPGDPRSPGPRSPSGTPQGSDPVSQLGQMYQQQMMAWQMPKQQLLNWGQQVQQMPWGPNYGNTPDSRPSPWSQQVTGQFGNTQQDMWNNMGGFIQSVNDQAMQKPVGVYQGQGNPGAGYGKVNYDIRELINQGNQMVQGGWQNPFAQQSPGAANFNSFLASQGIPPMPVGQQGPSLPANAYIKAGPDFAAPAGYEYSSFTDKNGNGAGWYDTSAMAKHSASVDAWNSGGREQAFQDSLAAMNDWQNKYGAIASQYRPSMPQYTRPGAPSQPPPPFGGTRMGQWFQKNFGDTPIQYEY